MKNHYDAVVVGAGPAGWSAAVGLNQAGWTVLVIDQARFPRDKVCGGFLSHENREFLTQLGVWDALKAQGAREVNQVRISAGRSSFTWREKNAEDSLGLGVSRSCMDETFRKVAEKAGVEFRDQTTICKSAFDGQNHAIELINRADHSRQNISASHLVWAAGAPKIYEQRPDDLVGAYALFDQVDVPADEVGLYFVKGGHLGLNPFENGLTNACYAVTRRTFEACQSSPAAVFQYLQTANPQIKKTFSGAKLSSAWKSVSVARRDLQFFDGKGTFFTGDAAAVIHPIVGGGMTLAMTGGYLLGSLLGQSRPASVDRLKAAKAYENTFRKLYAFRIKSAWWLGQAMHKRKPAQILVSAGKASGQIFRSVFDFNHRFQNRVTHE